MCLEFDGLVYDDVILRSTALFKWVAEYTRRTPWCYVLYEDTKVAWLFPENIDRLVINPSSRFRAVADDAIDDEEAESGVQTVQVDFPNRNVPRLSYLHDAEAGPLAADAAPRYTRMRKDFSTLFETRYNEFRKMIRSPPILLSGAPGIGKTVYVTKKFKQQKAAAAAAQTRTQEAAVVGAGSAACGEVTSVVLAAASPGEKNMVILEQSVDGSDDVFTRRSLRDELRDITKSSVRARNDTTTKTVLIIDEVGNITCNKVLSRAWLAAYVDDRTC